jgi:hypothetical protein
MDIEMHMKPTFRVIFDRSAFHGSNFDSLRDSPLKRLCRAGIIAVYHTPNFISETLGAFATPPRNWLAEASGLRC